MSINSAQSGMTLIQMAGILLIISIMMVPFFQIQSLIKKTEIRYDSQGQVEDISQALVQFALVNGRYPLPANPFFPLDNTSSGIEGTLTDSGVLTGPGNTCHAAVVLNDLRRCVNGVGTPFPLTPPLNIPIAENRIIIGTVPYAVLGLTPAQSLDEYGNKMTYAVTYGLTKAATFRNDRGNIRVRDQAATAYLVKVPVYDSDRAHFVVVSNGQNRLGAFPGNGGARTCTATSPVSDHERENCDIDSEFRVLSSRPDGDATTTIFPPTNWLKNPGTNTGDTFDDLLAFRTSINTGSWTARVVPGTGTAANRYQTYLSYGDGSNNVFVGESASDNVPALISTGAGQVQVDGSAQASRIETDYLCSIKNPSNNTPVTNNQAQACLLIRNFVERRLPEALPWAGMFVSNPDGAEVNSWMRAVVRGGASGQQNGFLNILPTLQNNVQINPQSVKGYNAVGMGLTATGDGLCPSGARGLDNIAGEVRMICD